VISLRWLTGIVAALALVAAGCGGTTAQVGAGASSLVPASAPAFIAIDSDPSSQQWQTIDALASKFPDKQQAVDSIKQDLSKQDVSWEQDVKPVLQGELDFVWLDLRNNGQNFVMLLQPKDEAKFKQLVAKASDQPAYDKFRGWYVIATKRETIDRFEHESNAATSMLADHKTFVQSIDRLGDDSIVRAYVNGKSLMNVPKLRPIADKVGKLDWIALRVGATSEGIGLDTIVHGTLGALFKGGSSKLLGRVPGDALVYLSFHGSKGMFNGLGSQFQQLARPLQQLGRILEGENAIYVRPGSGLPEVTLLATPPKGTNGAAIVDRLVKRYAGGAVPSLYYANVGGHLVVSDRKAALRAAKVPGVSLSDSDEFKQAKEASGMPDNTSSTLFVNVHASVPYVEKLAGQHIPAEIARNIKPLRSAVEYAASHTHELQVTFFLRIK
jgi:hypothetical protein